MDKRDEFLRYLSERLSPARLRHCIGVEQTCRLLAAHYGADVEKAAVAGLLHDCAKGMPATEALELAKRLTGYVDSVQQECPDLLHPQLGAYLIVRDLKIDDAQILSAVAHHTCGYPGMTRLDAVVNLADYIEPTRSYPDVEEMRKLAWQTSLEETLCECFRRTMMLILQTPNGRLHPDILITWNHLQRMIEYKEKFI